MFNNVVLDVFIGLTFIFLLYSLLATIFQELIAHILSLRARMLYKGIKRMLEDGEEGKTFIGIFYDHPTIKYLAENKVFNKPSYLRAETFSQTLIHILRGEDYTNAKSQMSAIQDALNKNPNSIATETLKHLNNLYIDAQGDIDRFRSKLEEWYNNTMDRVSGWYKRQTQWILLCIGFIVAGIGNIDTIKIYNILAKDKTAREQIVNMAIQSQQKYAGVATEIKKNAKDTIVLNNKTDSDKVKAIIFTTGDSILDKTYKNIQDDADQAGGILGVGWCSSKTYKKYKEVTDSLDFLKKKKDPALSARIDLLTKRKNELCELRKDKFSWYSIFGWFLTALAISLGAPFWFDLLNKFISLRAGTKPKDSSTKNNNTSNISPVQRVG